MFANLGLGLEHFVFSFKKGRGMGKKLSDADLLKKKQQALIICLSQAKFGMNNLNNFLITSCHYVRGTIK